MSILIESIQFTGFESSHKNVQLSPSHFRTFTAVNIQIPEVLSTLKSLSCLSQKVPATFMPVFLPWYKFPIIYHLHTHSATSLANPPQNGDLPSPGSAREETWRHEAVSTWGQQGTLGHPELEAEARNPGGAEETGPEWAPNTGRAADAPI